MVIDLNKDQTLICGDALIHMRAMIDSNIKVDCIVTDPPYKLTSGGPSGLMGGSFDPENYNNNGSIVPCDIDWNDFMPLIYQLMDQGHAYIMCNNRNVQAMLNSASAVGFEFHNLLVWDKITATPNRWYMKNCEFTGLFYKGKARKIKDCSSMQLMRVAQKDQSSHPTEKPVSLMAHYIANSTKAGDLVLDPFMGSGTTGIAAAQMKRRFIGIEKDKDFFQIAVDRINNSGDQYMMF